MLVLYYSPPTGNSYKVRLLLSIRQIPYEAIEVDIFNGGNRTPEYLSIKPVWQGARSQIGGWNDIDGIECHSCVSRDRNGLFPRERLLHARVLQWMFFEQYSNLPYIGMRGSTHIS